MAKASSFNDQFPLRVIRLIIVITFIPPSISPALVMVARCVAWRTSFAATIPPIKKYAARPRSPSKNTPDIRLITAAKTIAVSELRNSLTSIGPAATGRIYKYT